VKAGTFHAGWIVVLLISCFTKSAPEPLFGVNLCTLFGVNSGHANRG
jgi:hypothetical protein